MSKTTLKDLKNRRSIRSFTPDQLKDEDLDAILEAGTWAPSGAGSQSATIVVIQNKTLIKKLEKLNAGVLGNPKAKPFFGAPTLLAVLADPAVRPTYVEDGSLVIGNMLNAAYALGAGACWIHRAKQVFETEEGKALKKKWGIVDTAVGIGFCILGYPAETPKAKPRKEHYIVRVK
jgi:nitroreductase